MCPKVRYRFHICLLVRSAGHIISALWPGLAHRHLPKLRQHKWENWSSSLSLSLSSHAFLSRHFILLKHMDCHRYLPNIVWQRRSGNFYWLKIKVTKSPPQIPPFLLEPLKNRGKHQFLTHQWRLHNQLKKTLVCGCKSYLCLIKAFRRYMPGFNVIKWKRSVF